MKVPRCPLCDQPAYSLAPELLSLQLKRKEVIILAELVKQSPRSVPLEVLLEMTTLEALHVYICRIRKALAEVGLPWKIASTYREGYCLLRGEEEYGKDRVAQRKEDVRS